MTQYETNERIKGSNKKVKICSRFYQAPY